MPSFPKRCPAFPCDSCHDRSGRLLVWKFADAQAFSGSSPCWQFHDGDDVIRDDVIGDDVIRNNVIRDEFSGRVWSR